MFILAMAGRVIYHRLCVLPLLGTSIYPKLILYIKF
uniref:Uncharacterized protein n=1 Tax=Picea glauca TaxID=3330 RepID=A0A117NGX9_PICGL|nr:hypothetical protein ABT39_MTgene5711 [Picea glauca]